MASVDMVELLSALVVADCIEVDTAEDVSGSAVASKVDEVTCCVGDEKRALCADAEEVAPGLCCATPPLGEADELTDWLASRSRAADEVDGPGSMPESSCS